MRCSMSDPRLLALGMADRLDASIRAALVKDPWTGIENNFGLSVRAVDSERLSSGCGIEGRYHPSLKLIEVSDDLHPQSQRFVLLHELGHHLAVHDAAVRPHIAARPRVEESTANSFATELLIPSATMDDVFAGGVTARGVAELHDQSSPVSRWACCVRAAERVPGNGHVVIAHGDMIEFSATVGTAFPLDRYATQPDNHLISAAAANGSARRSHERLYSRDGVASQEFAGDAYRTADGFVFAVFSDANIPPWGDGWTGTLQQTKVWLEVDCEVCDRTTWGRLTCQTCGEPICAEDDCGWCPCKKRPVMRERMCTECWTKRPLGQFDGDGTICIDHRL